MIILDTNVVSEPLKPHPSAVVINWLDLQPIETLYITATILAELLLGQAILPAGKRQIELRAKILGALRQFPNAHILPFDAQAAESYTLLIARTRAAGRTVTIADSQIAAIALAKGYQVATRDTAPFLAAGVDVINPWER